MSKNIAVIIGSTRPSRIGANVTNWVLGKLPQNSDVKYELVDLAEWNLPLLDEVKMPSKGEYEHEHSKKWSAKISEFDGFVVVSPEYNAGYPAALKNAVDYLYSEWLDKPVTIITYGWSGGASSNNQLHEVFTRLKMKITETNPKLYYGEDFFDENDQIKDIEASFGKFSTDITQAGEELLNT